MLDVHSKNLVQQINLKLLKKYPDHIVLSYINCSAEIKALSDVIVTSSNAAKIINTFPKIKRLSLHQIDILEII